MLKDNQIFIHIPKTGGTTLNCLLFDTDNPIVPSYNYRHIVYETKMSNSGVLFNPLKNDKFIDQQIFMMLRHPVDRVVSEYYFLKERSEFFNLLKPVPKTFKEYVNHRQTFNYNISFLLGKKIYCKEKMEKEDYRMVINAIEKLDIKIGIFEKFEKTLNYFQSEFDIKIPKEVFSKRITLKRPKISDLGIDIQNKIISNNALDYKLYQYALKKFEKISLAKNNKINFKGNKYDYALTYTNRFSLFEATLKGEQFVKINSSFFQELSDFLKVNNIIDSKQFVDIYIESTYNAIKQKFNKINFSTLDSTLETKEPLDKLDLISSFILKNKIISSKKIVFEKLEILLPEPKGILNKILKKLF